MDGNRRWARDRNLAIVEGHKAGGEALKRSVMYAYEHGISVWVFAAAADLVRSISRFTPSQPKTGDGARRKYASLRGGSWVGERLDEPLQHLLRRIDQQL